MTIRELSNIMYTDKKVSAACELYVNTIKGMRAKNWNRETEAAAVLEVLNSLEQRGSIALLEGTKKEHISPILVAPENHQKRLKH